MVTTHPLIVTVPVPVNVIPPQQKRYSPVCELNSTTLLGSLSSCRHPLNTVTVKLQLAVLLEASVAVQVTVVVPTGKDEPDITTWLSDFCKLWSRLDNCQMR